MDVQQIASLIVALVLVMFGIFLLAKGNHKDAQGNRDKKKLAAGAVLLVAGVMMGAGGYFLLANHTPTSAFYYF